MQIIKYGKYYILFSLLILIPGMISLGMKGLKLSIDFTGGSNYEFKLDSKTQSDDEIKKTFREAFESKGAQVKFLTVDKDIVTVRTASLDSNTAEKIKTSLNEKEPKLELRASDSIGPSIGKETTQKSFVAVAVASLCILLYIAYAFRNIPKPYSSLKFGASAIIAMLHDALMVLGIFSILGFVYGIEVDTLFITAVLTVIGFSVHDTIVVFDRIRENLRKLPASMGFEGIVNYSIVETLNRSLATSITVIITLLALLVLGGESIRYFVLALFIGIISGTYSSIFTAAPILVFWERRTKR